MDVSVTIANWNRAELLERCLQSIYATPQSIDFEIIVVDNASGDHSVAMVRERFPHVRLIINAQNHGYGRANNQAMAVAGGRYIVVLNNDAAVFPETIPALVKFMDLHPRAGLCGCPTDDEIGDLPYHCFPTVARRTLYNLWLVFFRPPFGWGNGWFAEPLKRYLLGEVLDASSEQEAAWMGGALLFLRKKMIEEIGGFDEQFYFYGEAIDLCRRARAAGWTIMFTRSTSYAHQGGASSELRTDTDRLLLESGANYFRKYQGRLAAGIFRAQHYLLQMCLLRWRYGLGHMARILLGSANRRSGKASD